MKNSTAKTSPAPKQLSREAKSWWRRINQEWKLDDPGLLILESALECLDRMREAQTVLGKDGITIEDRFGQVKQHPATLVERDCKANLLRHLKALNLDIEPLSPTPGRQPGK